MISTVDDIVPRREMTNEMENYVPHLEKQMIQIEAIAHKRSSRKS